MLYKVTDEDGESHHGGRGKWTKGRWRSVRGELVACKRGLHLCRRSDLARWLGPVIWEAEYDGELVEAGDKVVARKARVTRRLDTWNDRTARLFAADCAEYVLPIFESRYPDNGHPRRAIEAARAFANGEIGDAARDAAWDAARVAARDAAWDAARAAAWVAARAAARDAAWDAAGDAARAAARAAFYEWATDRLFFYLDGEVEL